MKSILKKVSTYGTLIAFLVTPVLPIAVPVAQAAFTGPTHLVNFDYSNQSPSDIGSINLDSAGRIYANANGHVWRLLADGTPDPTFQDVGSGGGGGIAVFPSGDGVNYGNSYLWAWDSDGTQVNFQQSEFSALAPGPTGSQFYGVGYNYPYPGYVAVRLMSYPSFALVTETNLGTFGTSHDGLAATSGGRLYIVKYTENKVVSIPAIGQPIDFEFGSGGAGDGQFALTYKSGIAVDGSGRVYVVDTLNSRVQIFDDQGVYIGQFGSPGTLDGQFDSPSSIEVDSIGNIYVVDQGNLRIQKFAPLVESTPTPTPTGDYKDILTFSLQEVGNGAAGITGIEGEELRVFKSSEPAFMAAYGAGYGQWKTKLDAIYNGSVGLVSSCETDVDGGCTAYKSAAANYLVVGRYADTEESKTVYVSKEELATDFTVDKEAFADLKIQKHYKKGAFDKYGPPGQVIVVTGIAQADSNFLHARIGAMSVGSIIWLLVGFGLGLVYTNRNMLLRKK